MSYEIFFNTLRQLVTKFEMQFDDVKRARTRVRNKPGVRQKYHQNEQKSPTFKIVKPKMPLHS